MHREEIKQSLATVCGHSPLLRKGLFKVMDWLTVKSWHVRRELRKWMRTAPANAHILDAGTGFGHNAYWLSCQQERFSVLAIDDRKERVCSGNSFVRDSQRSNLLFRTMKITELDEPEAFDLIVCTETLECIDDDEHALSNLHESLRTGGLMITTVNRKYRSENFEECEVKRCGYRMNDLKEKFRASGFHHVKAHYTSGKSGRLAQQVGVTIPLKMLRLTRLFVLLLPFYFALAIPTSVILNWLDSHTAHGSGQGILVLARK